MMAKKVFVVTHGEVVNTTGGTITSFKNIVNILCEKYETVGICFTENLGTPTLNDNAKFFNLYHHYNGQLSFSDAINTFIDEQKPDIILFFFAYLYIDANLSDAFASIPKLILFRSRPDFYFSVHKNMDKLASIYKNTTSQVLFPSYINLLPDYIKNNNVVCIPNFVQPPLEIIDNNIEKKKIIYLSRIDCWKGQEFLIKSFALIASKYKDWSIDIYGQSQPPMLETYLKLLVKQLHLEKQIHFCGITKEPLKTYLNYDFCVFPSYFEGFPNGLADALSCGLPSVGFKAASGVNELITDGENGFLCEENLKDFAQKIEKLISNKDLRQKLGKNAAETIKKYERNYVANLWFDCIDNLTENNFQNKNYTNENKYSDLFPLEKIISLQNYKTENSSSIKDKIFSVKYQFDGIKIRKIYTILGIKLAFKVKTNKENLK